MRPFPRSSASDQRLQLDCRGSRLPASQVSRVLERAGRVVFREVRTVDGVVEAPSSSRHRTDGELATANLNGADRIGAEGSIPALGLDAPRPNEQAPAYHDDPDADESMRGPAGSNPQHLGDIERGNDCVRETSCRRQVR